MHGRLLSYLLCFILVTSVNLAMTATAHSQTPDGPIAAAEGKPSGELDFQTANKVAALDDKLAEALTLYYDGKFAQALPIFNSISADVETMDLMWWLGTTAMNTGDTKLTIAKFQKMLAVDPGLHRVRLELAAAYFQLKQYNEARRELEIVKQANPPQDVQKNIDRLLAAIDESTKKVFWNVRFSQGIQWDSNISSGPDQKELSVTGGTLSLADDTKKLGDWASIENFSGNVLYDLGDKGGFMWNTTADVYNQFYFHYGKYNYLLGDVTTGPWWVGPNDIAKVPVGISKQEYGSSPLSTIYHIRPSLEHYFTPYFSLRGQFSWSRENFMDSSNYNLNNTTTRYELTPNFYFMNRRHIVSLNIGYELSIADSRSFTYTAPYAAISYFTRFPTKTDLFLRYQLGERNYKAAPVLYNDERVDRRQSWSIVLSQEFLKHYFTSFAFNYIDNHSNDELYSFTKETYTLSVGFYF